MKNQILTGEGNAIKGAKIIGEARKISEPTIISKTGRHKAQRTILRDNAVCWIDKKLRYIK